MENLAIAIVAHKIFDVSALGIVLARAGVRNANCMIMWLICDTGRFHY